MEVILKYCICYQFFGNKQHEKTNMSSQENIKIKCSVNFLKVLQSASEERTSQPRWSTNLAELASPDYDPHLNLDAIKESRRSLFIEGTTSGPESEYPHCIDTQLTAYYTTYSTQVTLPPHTVSDGNHI